MKNVLLVFDVPGWAWNRMCQGIQKYSPDEFSVDICSQGEFGKFNKEKDVLSRYDGISQCSWAESSTNLPYDGKMSTWAASHFNYEYPVKDKSNIPSRIATRIRNIHTASTRFLSFDSVLCVSDSLYEHASKLHKGAVRVVPGIDTSVFYPDDTERERLTVGWCGQSKGTTKGYQQILLPLMARNPHIKWVVNTLSYEEALSSEQMRDWYNSIDIYLSTSCSEGFQMTIPEAMACNKPVIATQCGAVSECIDIFTGSIVDPYHDADSAKIAVGNIESEIRSLAGLDFHNNPNDRAVELFNWKERSREWLKAMV